MEVVVISHGLFIYFYESIFNYIIMIKSYGISMAFFTIKGGKSMKNGDLKGG